MQLGASAEMVSFQDRAHLERVGYTGIRLQKEEEITEVSGLKSITSSLRLKLDKIRRPCDLSLPDVKC